MADPGRRRLRSLVLAGLGVVVAWGLLTGVALFSAHLEIRSGLRAVDQARAGADASALVDGTLLPRIKEAQTHFARAHRRVGGPLFAPARILPVAGRQLRSVRALSGTASTVASVAAAGIAEAQPILAQPGGTAAARASTTRQLGDVAARSRRRLRGLSLGPRRGLVPPLARARNRLAVEVAEVQGGLDKAAVGASAVADILTGPRRYLLFAANNAEMRAGAGMFLSAGELETGPDGIVLNDMKTVNDIPLPPEGPPLTGDLADRWGWLRPNLDWRNLMTSPRFDASASLAAQMWTASGHRPVDGVIALDPAALGGLLGAIGPVEVDGRQVSQDNVEDEMLHEQYLRFPDEATPERREELGGIARAVFAALDRGDWSVSRLATGLASAGNGRHLLMWSTPPAEQSAWTALGVDGSLGADSLLLSVLNRAGNKLDYFLPVRAEVGLAAVGRDTEVTVTVHVANKVPEGEPTYVAGPHIDSGVGEGVYLGILTLDLPGAAFDAGFDGVDQLAVAGADGPCQVIGFQLTLPRGAEQTVVARFRLPGNAGSIRVEPSARVPAVAWRLDRSGWSDTAAKLLTWAK